MERDLSRADLDVSLDRLSGEDSDSVFLRTRDPLWALSASDIDADNDLSLSRADPLDDDLFVVELLREVSLDRAALVDLGCTIDWDSLSRPAFLPVALPSLSLDTPLSDLDSPDSRRPLRRVGDDCWRSLFRFFELRSL